MKVFVVILFIDDKRLKNGEENASVYKYLHPKLHVGADVFFSSINFIFISSSSVYVCFCVLYISHSVP